MLIKLLFGVCVCVWRGRGRGDLPLCNILCYQYTNFRDIWICLLCSFYHESLRTWIKTTANKFAVSDHTALISGLLAVRSYLKLICEYKLRSLPIKKVSGAKDNGKNYFKVRTPLVRHLLRNRLLLLRIESAQKHVKLLSGYYDFMFLCLTLILWDSLLYTFLTP